MSCTNPVNAWRRHADPQSPQEPRRLHFSPQAEYGTGRPFEFLRVGCGKCDGCRADRAREWSIRAYHESTLHDRNCFLTLTYEDAPPKLVKKDLQDFFKRARHDYKFRYLACGEYGDRTRRPHYHALIFGEDFLGGKVDINGQLYTNPRLAEAWGHGLVSVGALNMATCCYVAGYVFKKIGDKETFSLQSRRPGIGHDWLDKYGDDIRRTGIVTIEGKEYPVPRRYLDWHSDQLAHVKEERAAIFSSMSYDKQRSKEDQLPAKATNQRSKLGLRSKPL